MPTLQFRDLQIKLRDFGPHDKGLTWANVKMSFRDAEHDIYPSLEVVVPIPNDESEAVAESRQHALVYAQSVLGYVLSLLREHDLQSLRHLEREFENAEEARLQQRLEASSSTFKFDQK
jgi:hypothetical protein